MRGDRLIIAVANGQDLSAIYRMRHEVYAAELNQYEARPDGVLSDSDQIRPVYIAAWMGGKLAGFIGMTPPESPRYSVDRYLARTDIPAKFDDHLYEIRALTVLKQHRGRMVAAALMYAAFRWVEARGGRRIIAIGRRDVAEMYRRVGMKNAGPTFTCGSVTYDLMLADVSDIAGSLESFALQLNRLESQVDWRLDVVFRRVPSCYHGGAFFSAIGETFDNLQRRESIISADVLDAWFPPAPAVQETLARHFEWAMRTSPPTHAEGLVRVIAEARGVDPDCILTGGGSSSLMFLALRHWLTSSSRVLILDPTYGEYAHILEQLVRCRVERFQLDRRDGYRLDKDRLFRTLEGKYDLFVWVNPNNPTGLHVSKSDVEDVLARIPERTRVWMDETYVEYAGSGQTLEPFAARSRNILVCKSLSKVYALSGLRVGYLCAAPDILEPLRPISPPWAVSLVAQIAATIAIRETDYYSMRYRETRELRAGLMQGLCDLGIHDQVPGIANFVMFHLPTHGPDAGYVAEACRARGLYLRTLDNMGSSVGRHALRIAVKDGATNERMLGILSQLAL